METEPSGAPAKISYKAMLYKIRQVGLDDRPERGSEEMICFVCPVTT